MPISISKGNSKMGEIHSVSLPAVITCRVCDCQEVCYARKIERLRPSVKAAYLNNWRILCDNPEQYWREVEASIMTSRFFRFHVSGDIPSKDYFKHMLDISRKNQHCEILCFTKKYEVVKNFLDKGEVIPGNLHIVLSAWRGLKMNNPYNLPEAHVRYRDGTTTAGVGAKLCEGNCTHCAITESGCWALKPGEQILFNEH